MYRFVTYPASLFNALPPFSEPGFLVNQVAQLAAQSAAGGWVVGALNEATGQLDARCAFFKHNDLAISPKSQSFGSVEFVETLPDEVIGTFLDALIAAVKMAGLSSLRLVHYPRAYAPRQTDRLREHLSVRGFTLVEVQRNFHITVSEKSYAAGLHNSARRRLKQSQRAGLVARQWSGPDSDQVISFLETSRKAQGYPLTIAPDHLRHLLTTYPDDYLVFAVFDHTIIAAITVAVRIRADILYNFLPADAAQYRPFSPAIMLTECLYTYCQQQQISLLDLGISVDEYRQPKPELMRFKRNLGAVESEKITVTYLA